MSMEENTQLPKERTKDEILHSRPIVSNNKGSDLYVSLESARVAMQTYADQYATKLHQANEVIKVLEYDNNRLNGEVEGLTNAVDELKRWKAEAMILLSNIDHYADKHPEIKLGMGKVEFTIERAKKYDESAAGREDAVAIMLWAFTNISAWDKAANKVQFFTGESYSVSELLGIFKQQKEK